MVSEPTDDDAFAQALADMLDDPGERERLGCAGRHRAVNEYSWRCVAERLEEYYRDLISARQGR